MVAIAGGTSDVGKAIVKAFTASTFTPHFSKVIHCLGTGCMLEVVRRHVKPRHQWLRQLKLDNSSSNDAVAVLALVTV
jgi:hypothetical protein